MKLQRVAKIRQYFSFVNLIFGPILLGKEMVDYIADYLQNIRERRVFPAVKPGYLRRLVPSAAPDEPEPWDTIFGDIERVIMPGVLFFLRLY